MIRWLRRATLLLILTAACRIGRPAPAARAGAVGTGHACPALWQDRLVLQLLAFLIDCPDPMKLAGFSPEVRRSVIREASFENNACITFGEVDVGFQRVEDYRPPRWPDDEHPKQYHLDFEVDEIEPEQRRVVKLGATLQKDFIGPDGYGWQVYTDPVGHPFCLCRHEGVTWTDKGVAWP